MKRALRGPGLAVVRRCPWDAVECTLASCRPLCMLDTRFMAQGGRSGRIDEAHVQKDDEAPPPAHSPQGPGAP